MITPCNRTRHIYYNQSISIANNEYFSKKYQTFVSFFILIFLSLNPSIPHAIQVQRWKTSYNQYRICYTGDLPGDFLRIKFWKTVQSGLIPIVYLVSASMVPEEPMTHHDVYSYKDALFINNEWLWPSSVAFINEYYLLRLENKKICLRKNKYFVY